jgi:hypothetical protein
VAQGSIEELRAGVSAQSPGLSGERLTLEEIFLRIVGGEKPAAPQELSWLE